MKANAMEAWKWSAKYSFFLITMIVVIISITTPIPSSYSIHTIQSGWKQTWTLAPLKSLQVIMRQNLLLECLRKRSQEWNMHNHKGGLCPKWSPLLKLASGVGLTFFLLSLSFPFSSSFLTSDFKKNKTVGFLTFFFFSLVDVVQTKKQD